MSSRGRGRQAKLRLLGLIALAMVACARSRATTVPPGPAPAAILLTPSAGEDFVPPILYLGPIWRTVSGPVFARELWRFRPDVEMSRPDLMTADGDTIEVAHVMAVLDRAAREGDAKCPPVRGYPTWPATWNVRVFDRATPDSAHVAREFTVSARAVRCMAGAELAALKDDRDATWRSGMEQLATLGLPQTEPPMPRPLLARPSSAPRSSPRSRTRTTRRLSARSTCRCGSGRRVAASAFAAHVLRILATARCRSARSTRMSLRCRAARCAR